MDNVTRVLSWYLTVVTVVSQSTSELSSASPQTVQATIFALQQFWADHGCAVLQPHDKPVGAGTFHPATFLRCQGEDPWRAVYIQPCRRPSDGRYGKNPNRLQHYYQLQVVLKPSPEDVQELYLESLTTALGLDAAVHDVRFVEDNWESPTLGAWGVGWEVWLNGMEITQFTYFQQSGGIALSPTTVELTYGLERICMYLQGVESVYDLQWSDNVSYGDLFSRNEFEMSYFNYQLSDVDQLRADFAKAMTNCHAMLEAEDGQAFALPASEFVMDASHHFNLLMARRVLSVADRQAMVLQLRKAAQAVSHAWINDTSS